MHASNTMPARGVASQQIEFRKDCNVAVLHSQLGLALGAEHSIRLLLQDD